MNAYLQDSPGVKGPGITRGGDRGVDRPGAEQLYGDDRGQAGVTRIHGPRVASQLASEAGYADSRREAACCFAKAPPKAVTKKFFRRAPIDSGES